MDNDDKCPKCGSALGEITTTKSGKKLQRCSTGSWVDGKVEGCDFVKWLPSEAQTLDEKCPKCGAPLLMAATRFGKRMKKCSTNKWDPATKTASGCDYVEWMKTILEPLEEDCPKCGSKLVQVETASGKRFKKCSTNQWDRENKVAVGCDYIDWGK